MRFRDLRNDLKRNVYSCFPEQIVKFPLPEMHVPLRNRYQNGDGNALFHPVAQSGKNKLSKERKVDKTTCKSVQSRENNFETIAKLKNNFICQLTWFYPLWNWNFSK